MAKTKIIAAALMVSFLAVACEAAQEPVASMNDTASNVSGYQAPIEPTYSPPAPAPSRTAAPAPKRTATATKTAPKPASPSCHPSYKGACLKPDASDYDCAGGSGDGPYYVDGPIQVVAYDEYKLDRDGDGVACEN